MKIIIVETEEEDISECSGAVIPADKQSTVEWWMECMCSVCVAD